MRVHITLWGVSRKLTGFDAPEGRTDCSWWEAWWTFYDSRVTFKIFISLSYPTPLLFSYIDGSESKTRTFRRSAEICRDSGLKTGRQGPLLNAEIKLGLESRLKSQLTASLILPNNQYKVYISLHLPLSLSLPPPPLSHTQTFKQTQTPRISRKACMTFTPSSTCPLSSDVRSVAMSLSFTFARTACLAHFKQSPSVSTRLSEWLNEHTKCRAAILTCYVCLPSFPPEIRSKSCV